MLGFLSSLGRRYVYYREGSDIGLGVDFGFNSTGLVGFWRLLLLRSYGLGLLRYIWF